MRLYSSMLLGAFILSISYVVITTNKYHFFINKQILNGMGLCIITTLQPSKNIKIDEKCRHQNETERQNHHNNSETLLARF